VRSHTKHGLLPEPSFIARDNRENMVFMNILSLKMADVSRAGVFLATTALEDFWDVSYPIVFLSEGCKRYSRRAYWESFKIFGMFHIR